MRPFLSGHGRPSSIWTGPRLLAAALLRASPPSKSNHNGRDVFVNIKNQVRKLLCLEAVWSFRLGGSLWVLFLGLRGFSMAQIGLAEGFLHLVSLFGEVPSGLAADLLGRKKVLALSQGLFVLSAAMMLLSQTFYGVLLAMALEALGYNMASGTREALTYDSLLEAGEENYYLTLSSRQNMLYRGGSALATLLAGAALTLGWRASYAIDMLFSLAGVALAASLTEPVVHTKEEETPGTWKDYVKATVYFLRRDRSAVWLMLFNAVVGAAAILLGFYLQDALPRAGAPAGLLGPLLLMKGLGGVIGSRLAAPLGGLKRRRGWGICTAMVAGGFLLASTGNFLLMALAGLLAAVGDDGLELQVGEELNRRFPSSQRATLLSVSSLCFSLTMVVLSPLGGILVGS